MYKRQGDTVRDFLLIHGTHESIVPGVDVGAVGKDITDLSDPSKANRKIISGKGRDDTSLAIERPPSFESRKVDLFDVNRDGLKDLVLTGVDNQVVTLFADNSPGGGVIQYDTKDPASSTAVMVPLRASQPRRAPSSITAPRASPSRPAS